MFGIWLAVAEGTLLGFDAQRVIALRAMKIAAGGSSARSEVSRMVTEKVSAGAEAVAILTFCSYFPPRKNKQAQSDDWFKAGNRQLPEGAAFLAKCETDL